MFFSVSLLHRNYTQHKGGISVRMVVGNPASEMVSERLEPEKSTQKAVIHRPGQ